jgi:ribonuclease-3
MLASRIRVFGFQYELIMGKSDSDQSVHERDSVQEDLFEAIIGAVALDSNWDIDALTTVVDLMLDPDCYLDNGFDEEKNYVVLLQQWYQKKHNRIPVYVFRQTGGFPCAGKYGKYVCELGLYPLEDGFWDVKDTKSEARMAVAKQAYEYLEENDLLYDWIDEVGKPEIDRAINQLQELYQKGYIGEPRYNFVENYDSDGNPVWRCECHVDSQENYWWGEYSSKKQGKKAVAYDMLCDLLDWEDDDEA